VNVLEQPENSHAIGLDSLDCAELGVVKDVGEVDEPERVEDNVSGRSRMLEPWS
jgi:hypothetical protein